MVIYLKNSSNFFVLKYFYYDQLFNLYTFNSIHIIYVILASHKMDKNTLNYKKIKIK